MILQLPSEDSVVSLGTPLLLVLSFFFFFLIFILYWSTVD